MIEAIGEDNILNYLENNYPLGECIVIYVGMDGKIKNIFINDNKEIEDPKVLELKKQFQKYSFYSEYLSSNKAIIQTGNTSKLITSAIKEAVIFNCSTLISKTEKIYKNSDFSNIEKMYSEAINEYYSNLEEIEVDIEEKNVARKIKSYLLNLKLIDTLSEIQDYKKKKIKIFIDRPLKNYKLDKERYLQEKLFDTKTERKINNEIVGRYSGFITLNSKKPLLKLNCTDEINLITREEAIKQYYLLLYISKNRGEIKQKNTILKCSFNPKEMRIENFEIKFTNDKKQQIPYKNILNLDWYDEEEQIDISKKINYLLDGNLFKETKINKYVLFNHIYKRAIEKFTFEEVNEELNLKCNKLCKSLIDINKFDDIYKMQRTITFMFNLKDYIFKTNKIGEILNMEEKLFEKIKKYKDEFVIENDDEFLFLAGQMAHYLISRKKTYNKNNSLFNQYLRVKNVTRLKEILKMDMKRFGYEENINGRINSIFSKLILYKTNVELISNEDMLIAGLYSKNIFYKKYEKGVEENVKSQE